MSQRTLWAIDGNTQRLDGGAMFGNVPRALWQRWITPDDKHRIPLACRAMLIEDAGRRILFETGVGTFFEPRLRARFGVTEDEHVLLRSLGRAGITHADVDVVVLSHLHFDHAGGLLAPYEEGRPLSLLFPNATFVIGAEAWARANAPHARDRASFIPELPGLLEGSGRLELVQGDHTPALGDAYRLHRSDGHTPGLLLTEIASERGPVLFAADLIPGRPWVHLPITMGYDRFPERLIEEKTRLLTDLHERSGRLFFTHDAQCAMARITKDQRGRFSAGECWEDPAGLVI